MDSTYFRAQTDRPIADSVATFELATNFSETARNLFSAGSVTDTLARLVELAVATIEGCDFAGLFLLEEEVVSGPIHTDPIVGRVDELQHAHGEGPCLDAVTERVIFYADDLADDPGWPRFGPEASAAGIRSVLALPLATNFSLGGLNLYARYPAAFGVVDRAKGVVLASLASLAVSAGREPERRSRHPRSDRTGTGGLDGARTDLGPASLRHLASSLPAPQPQTARRGPGSRGYRRAAADGRLGAQVRRTRCRVLTPRLRNLSTDMSAASAPC